MFLDSITVIGLIKIILKISKALNTKVKPEKPFYLANKI